MRIDQTKKSGQLSQELDAAPTWWTVAGWTVAGVIAGIVAGGLAVGLSR